MTSYRRRIDVETTSYVYSVLLKEQGVVDTKLRFCLSARCVKGISSSYNNIRPLGDKSVLLDPQLERITAAEKEKVIAEKFNIDMDKLTVNYRFIFFLSIAAGPPKQLFKIRWEEKSEEQRKHINKIY